MQKKNEQVAELIMLAMDSEPEAVALVLKMLKLFSSKKCPPIVDKNH